MCLAVPGKIISIDSVDELTRTGKVDFGGIIRQVNLAFIPEAKVNDYVLIHAGCGIGLIDEETARQTLSDINQIFGENGR